MGLPPDPVGDVSDALDWCEGQIPEDNYRKAMIALDVMTNQSWVMWMYNGSVFDYQVTPAAKRVLVVPLEE